MKTGVAQLPLHHGHCPPWLFKKMKSLAHVITDIIINEYSEDEFLKRVSNPFWFQAFACVLGFDWHSSGVTTTVCGALKEAIAPEETGIVICGGKGKRSRSTPSEIQKFAEMFSLKENKIQQLIKASKLCAKVDNALIQDDYNLYHHCFMFTEKGKWAIIQQGMNPFNKYARRYHWLSEEVGCFVEEPHTGICCDKKEERVLDMTSKNSKENRKICVDIANEPTTILKYVKTDKHTFNIPWVKMPRHHRVVVNKKSIETLLKISEIKPRNYEELVAIKGVGPKSIRALALISQIIYGAETSWEDPAKFSFAHGGKDGHPFPVDRETYSKNIDILKNAINNAKLGNREKLQALKRLNLFIG